MISAEQMTFEDIRKIDKTLLENNVDLKSRPIHAAMEWLKSKGVQSSELDSFVKRAYEHYKNLYPNESFNENSMFVGGVMYRGEIYEAHVYIVFGTVRVDPLESIQIGQSEHEVIWQDYPEQGWSAFYTVGDIWDFAYGVNDMCHQSQIASKLWYQSKSYLASTVQTLKQSTSYEAAAQSTGMAAELAMKGTLAFLGQTENDLKKLGHDLVKIAKKLNALKPSTSKDDLVEICSKFPDFVNSRYSGSGLSKSEIGNLMLASQYVAGEALRRVSDRNMIEQFVNDPNIPNRVLQ